MRRISLWALSTLSVLVLLFSYSTSTSGPLAISSTTSQHGSGFSASTTSSSTTAGQTFTGQAVNTRYGPVQVQVTVADGKVTEVSVPEYPANNGRDYEINSRALPILTQETIDAQSTDIDMVSGATYTSDGYIRSLQSALDQAGL